MLGYWVSKVVVDEAYIVKVVNEYVGVLGMGFCDSDGYK